jgi:hypothetical protein
MANYGKLWQKIIGSVILALKGAITLYAYKQKRKR